MTRLTMTLALGLTLLAASCGGPEEPARTKAAAKEPAITESKPVSPELRAAPDRDAYLRQADARLEELKQAMNDMQAKLEKLSPELKARSAEQLKAMEARMTTARRKLQELRFAGGEAYKKLQAEVEALLEELKKRADQLPSGFQFRP